MSKSKKGLTKKEKKILKLTGKLWKLFTKLPIQHTSDMPEIQKGIHILQAAIMLRIARRDYPETFSNLLHKKINPAPLPENKKKG